MTEIKLFYDWLETHPLSPASIALWHALMFIANRSGWREELRISMSLLEMRTNMPCTTIFRQREILKSAGRITFNSQGGRAACIYRIIPLECHFVCRPETQSGIQTTAQTAVVPQVVPHSDTLYRLNRDNNSSDIPESWNRERKNSAKKREMPWNADRWLAALDTPWRELMAAWLEYKRTRRESYTSELGGKEMPGHAPQPLRGQLDHCLCDHRPQCGEQLGRAFSASRSIPFDAGSATGQRPAYRPNQTPCKRRSRTPLAGKVRRGSH